MGLGICQKTNQDTENIGDLQEITLNGIKKIFIFSSDYLGTTKKPV